MIQGLFVVFLFLFLGNGLSILFHIPIPGNVIGMMLLTLALMRGWVKLKTVQPSADVLVRNMALFFVPPGVGLILYLETLRNHWPGIVTALFLGTFLVIGAVGLLQQKLESGK